MTTFEQKLDAGVAKIKAAGDLWDLHQALVAFEQTTDEDGQPPYEFDTETTLRSRGVDICELPVFGGESPKSTDGVWSWDESSILAGEGPFTSWEIRERK
jgi:hypothetical protein